MLDFLLDPNLWVAFATLTVLEIVLGIDNVVFISVLADRLPEAQRAKARRLGLALAMAMRIALLFSVAWIMGLTAPWFAVAGTEVSGRDIILIVGGLFLLTKATHEIHASLEGPHDRGTGRGVATFGSVLAQIVVLDAVFSLDSVITAVGMVDDIGVMVAAIVVAVGVMMLAAAPISAFVSRHPTVKMLALSFLILIGCVLVAEGFDQHIPKGYIYFAMAFALGVEMLNLRLRKPAEPVALRVPYEAVRERE
jgi:predicted tellurium resistance membrane protein TerC